MNRKLKCPCCGYKKEIDEKKKGQEIVVWLCPKCPPIMQMREEKSDERDKED